MSLAVTLATLLLVETAEANVADFTAIQAVHADEVVLPITRCAQTKLAAHVVQKAEVGNRAAAVKAFGESLSACGLERGQKELQMRLSKAYPAATPDDTLRQVRTAFAMPVVLVLGDAMERFDVQPPPSPSPVPIPVPCPPEGQPKPEACRAP